MASKEGAGCSSGCSISTKCSLLNPSRASEKRGVGGDGVTALRGILRFEIGNFKI